MRLYEFEIILRRNSDTSSEIRDFEIQGTYRNMVEEIGEYLEIINRQDRTFWLEFRKTVDEKTGKVIQNRKIMVYDNLQDFRLNADDDFYTLEILLEQGRI